MNNRFRMTELLSNGNTVKLSDGKGKWIMGPRLLEIRNQNQNKVTNKYK